MEVLWDFDNISPQLKYLLDNNAELLNPSVPEPPSKKGDKLTELAMPDLGAAYLVPQIWNKTMMSDDLKLEPVDWDELLSENVVTDMASEQQTQQFTDLALLMCPNASEGYSAQQQTAPSGIPKVVDNCEPNSSLAIANAGRIQPALVSPKSTMEPVCNPAVIPLAGQQAEIQQPVAAESEISDVAASPSTKCDYSPSITDAMISTPANDVGKPKELFDPRSRPFTDEELKPQPIIRKAKKVYVPDDCKDNKYWRKREKNNVAAKRSREARRIKENQIAMRANYLEKENDSLRSEVTDLREELKRLIEIVNGYQGEQKN